MDQLLKKQIKTFMTKNVIAVKSEDSIRNVFDLMKKHDIVGLPVVNENMAVVGIVTESDLIKHFTTLSAPIGINVLGSVIYLDDLEDWSKNLKQHAAVLVKDIMNAEVVTIMDDASLSSAIDKMAKEGINRLPVVDITGKLSGIVTRKDIVNQLAQLKNL